MKADLLTATLPNMLRRMWGAKAAGMSDGELILRFYHQLWRDRARAREIHRAGLLQRCSAQLAAAGIVGEDSANPLAFVDRMASIIFEPDPIFGFKLGFWLARAPRVNSPCEVA